MRWSKKYTRIKIYEIYEFEGKNNTTENVRKDTSVFVSMFWKIQWNRIKGIKSNADKYSKDNAMKFSIWTIQWNIIWRQYWYSMIKKWPPTAYYVRASVNISDGLLIIAWHITIYFHNYHYPCQSRVEFVPF